MIIIPYQQLASETLDALLEEYVTRDGTDYGEYEVSTSDKLSQVKALLKTGEIHICYDEETESCTLLDKEQAQQLQQQS